MADNRKETKENQTEGSGLINGLISSAGKTNCSLVILKFLFHFEGKASSFHIFIHQQSVPHFRNVGSTLAFCAAATVCEHTSGLNLNIRHVHIIWPSSVRVTELVYCVDRLWTEYLMTHSSSDGI